MTELLFHFMSSVEPLSIMIHSPNGFNFDGLDGPDDLRRRFVAVRRSMNAEVRSLDAMVNFNHNNIIAGTAANKKNEKEEVK